MEDEASITIGVVAHWVFCPRRAWLEVHGEKTDTAQMAVGVMDHAAVDDPSTSRGERRRAVDVRSAALGVHGRCDTVEIAENGALTVVEHKATPVRRRASVTRPNEIQLGLQAACLQEAGENVVAAAVWFTTHKVRVEVPLDAELRAAAVEAVGNTRAVMCSVAPPPPLEEDDRCGRCSHVSVCLPDEHRQRPVARGIGVADPPGSVLHLATPGSRARLRRGKVEVSARDADVVSVPVEQVSGLVVHGNADVSSALLRNFMERSLSIVWCSWSGRVVGWTSSANGPNGDLRGRQHELVAHKRLSIARNIVAAKIENQRHVMRRAQLDGRGPMRDLAVAARTAGSIEQALGYEGRAAAAYFGAFDGAVRPDWASFERRVSRSPSDPVNAALNVVYSLLLADVIRAVVACGLDPAGGILHTAGHNKPALALDLMEEFRPVVADSAVLWAINNGELHATDFRSDFGAVRMTERGRKALIATYERRATSEFVHPVFGYRVSWRRAMEVQARMFMSVVSGERDDYHPVRVR